ncbi:MAG: PepSY-like domain-containing protein [Lewinellaceae bacterium]|nr:PepSY-like domain-containing protein [Lewinellaceae bacterium]
MKKRISYLLGGLLAILLVGCAKDAITDFQQLDDEALATAIVDDRGKQEIDPSTLPAEILKYLEESYFETYIETAYFAVGKGYEVDLASDDRTFFNLNRRVLAHRLNDRLGPCGRLLGGTPIPVGDLRPEIVNYISTNYPDAQILRAKQKGGRVIVLISGHIILVFTPDGVHEISAQQWFDCRPCVPADVVDLPADVQALIDLRLPNAEVKRICRRGDRIVIGLIDGDGRHILVFDKDWNFLFAIP